MGKTQIGVRIDDDLLEAIDELAKAAGETRTEVVAGILERGVADEQAFYRRTRIPGVSTLVTALADAGVAHQVAKLLGREVDERRLKLIKDLREKRRAAKSAESKGAAL